MKVDITEDVQKSFGERIIVLSAILDTETETIDTQFQPLIPVEHINLKVKIDE
jgi:hypothetical protein